MNQDNGIASLYTSHVLLTSDPCDTSKTNTLITYLADKYTALRIAGLEQSPQSFSATLQGELRLTSDEKTLRIQVPNKHVMVIVKHAVDSTTSERSWYDDEWVGQATLYGPLSWGEYISPFQNTHANGNLSADQVQLLACPMNRLSFNKLTKTAYWHMTALYIDVNHRRLGLAKKLCVAAFEHIRNTSKLQGHDSAILRIIIKPTNTVVLDMYKNLGFEVIDGALSTLAEATICAGDRGSLPTDYEEQIGYTSRGGLFMLKHIDLHEA